MSGDILPWLTEQLRLLTENALQKTVIPQGDTEPFALVEFQEPIVRLAQYAPERFRIFHAALEEQGFTTEMTVADLKAWQYMKMPSVGGMGEQSWLDYAQALADTFVAFTQQEELALGRTQQDRVEQLYDTASGFFLHALQGKGYSITRIEYHIATNIMEIHLPRPDIVAEALADDSFSSRQTLAPGEMPKDPEMRELVSYFNGLGLATSAVETGMFPSVRVATDPLSLLLHGRERQMEAEK